MALLTFKASDYVLQKETLFILFRQNGWVGNQLNLFVKGEKSKKIKRGIPEFFLELLSLKVQKRYC